MSDGWIWAFPVSTAVISHHDFHRRLAAFVQRFYHFPPKNEPKNLGELAVAWAGKAGLDWPGRLRVGKFMARDVVSVGSGSV